jgi:hypothetical protein
MTMGHVLVFLVSLTTASGCVSRSGLFATHSPDAREMPLTVAHKPPSGLPLDRPPFRYMRYYRTEIRNVSNRSLKIVWFDAYRERDGIWYPGNVLGRALRRPEFSAWYTEGDRIDDGVIPSGKTTICDVNWHGSDSPEPMRTKWAFIAVDASGNDYYVEAEVEPSVLKLVDHRTLAGDRPGTRRRSQPGS